MPDLTTCHLYLLLQVADPASSITGYLLDIGFYPADTHYALYRANAGSYTTLIAETAGQPAIAVGDTYELTKTGAVLSVLRNGVAAGGSFGAFTDPSPLTGPGYVGFGGRDSNVLAVDDFTAGSLP